LRDISFDIQPGEVVGIIGGNGAGKSTLLKVLSRVTQPTTGYAEIRGRVGSLLEVGTGFHPELSGRENIYLNGAILGMRRTEIDRKFDQIVEFAEVTRFIDTPVKHYSSGMYLRLAFAVAGHLEPEILLIDEVLAVGDAAFQKKCLGKMNDVARQGRTVVFVSHNMDAIGRLCPRSLLLERGHVAAQGNTTSVISQYLSLGSGRIGPSTWIDISSMARTGRGGARFLAARYSSLNPAVAGYPYPGGPLEFVLVIAAESGMSVQSMAVTLYTQTGIKLINADTVSQAETLHLRQGRNTIRLRIEEVHLKPGIYLVGLWLGHVVGTGLDCVEAAFQIEVVPAESEGFGVTPLSDGVVPCRFSLSYLSSDEG
jgi:ABC-type polysaccharide/polyol phosphate transport system ATPase subunit